MAAPHDIDHLRERLRSLGYLDAPVDRYVLGSATARAGALRFAVGAGLRVGVIAGLLLGLSAAIALAARAPGFITSARDAVVLASVLSALFAIATAAAMTVAVVLASWYARRAGAITPAGARRTAAAGGIAAALACAAYLTLWWNAARVLFTGLTFIWNAAALAVAVGVALLLAHAVSVVILAALARSESAGDIRAGGILSSRAFLVVFGVLLFAGSSALLARGASRPPQAGAPAITVTPTGYTLRVVAIDGFDETVALDSGDVPAMTSLLGPGSGRIRFTRQAGDPDPARDWTTIATGQPPEVHGITALEARRAVGIGGSLPAAASGPMRSIMNAADLLRLTTPAIASGIERRSPAFWEVAAAAGLRTSVVNWWATWPARDDGNIAITDRALLRLDTGGALDAEIAPASLYDTLRARWPDARRTAAERAAAEFASIADPDLRKVIVRAAEIDLLVTALSRVNAGGPLDLLVVYLPGLDIAQHQLQASSPGSVGAMADRVSAIRAYYRFLDRLLAERLTPDDKTIDALILWPGRTSRDSGEMVVRGHPIRPQSAAACDDCGLGPGPAPTLLYLLGLPVAGNLGHRPGDALATDEFRTRHPLRTIASYDGVAARTVTQRGQPLDAEALERLRSLGYIR